jgi:hypothetical protein
VANVDRHEICAQHVDVLLRRERVLNHEGVRRQATGNVMLPCIAPSSALLAARRVSARCPLNNDLPTYPDHHARRATDSGSSRRSTIFGVANTALTWKTAAS